MKSIDRRQFLQVTAASYLLGSLGSRAAAEPNPPKISETEDLVKVEQPNYTWEWSRQNDRFRLLDQQGHVITSGPLQPAVVVQPVRQSKAWKSAAGTLKSHKARNNRIVWTYHNVNGSGKLTVAWRFEQHHLWIEPVIYEPSAAEDVVSLNLFGHGADATAEPSLETHALVLPGICESEAISPIAVSDVSLNTRTSLGRAGNGLMQQWALPSHYFCGFRDRVRPESEGTSEITQAFCCGLAEVPNGDVFVEQKGGRSCLVFDYRGDLWGHLRGPGKFTLGAGLFWALGPNYYEAIRNYYRGLLQAGIIHQKRNSAKKNAALLTPQWCSWGEQVAVHKAGSHLDQASLEKFYQELKASGMKAGMFSIDDKWEGKYGALQHSAERFPEFEQFLDRVRADGLRIGMWAAFMRCEDPADIDLTIDQMLHQVDGKPYVAGEGATKYYILDFTHPEVEKVLSDLARRYVRRYKPDLVKFDFGYEIPLLSTAAPHDMRWAGERMLGKGLDVVVKAMREEKPDIVVMYYELSPLFTEYFDLHSPDDLFEARGEYNVEANRRFFFSGLCGEFGMPTYGSSGYDWVSQPEIWFDSVAIGTLGCLGSFGGNDEAGSKPTPERLAKYNGLIHLVRLTNQFTIQPLDAIYDAVTRGAHASSWARTENGKVVLVALRPRGLDGGAGVNQWGGVLDTTAQVAVASLTEDSLAEADRLGVVPYGQGRLTLRRASNTSAATVGATEHYFGGHAKTTHLEVRGGAVEIPLREQSADGLPLEWIEITFRAT
ncbi:MAG TPA: TIM-barrel domain-containing protein [Terriglobia bacterium]|nr:TIM-barrel domain-containing protein [Terriglobia bacterium]